MGIPMALSLCADHFWQQWSRQLMQQIILSLCFQVVISIVPRSPAMLAKLSQEHMAQFVYWWSCSLSPTWLPKSWIQTVGTISMVGISARKWMPLHLFPWKPGHPQVCTMARYWPSSRDLVYDLCWTLGKSVLLGNCHQMEISVCAMNWKWVCLLNLGEGWRLTLW